MTEHVSARSPADANAPFRQAERAAWIIVWACFGLFILSVVGALLAWQWYREIAAESQPATLTLVKGSLLVRQQRQGDWVAASGNDRVDPGVAVRTAEGSEALVVLFDKSTLFLFPETELTLQTMTSSRFPPTRQRVVLTLQHGRVQIGVAPPRDGSKTFRVFSPHTDASLDPGSYSLTVEEGGTQVKVKEVGAATVKGAASSTSLALRAGQRTEVKAGAPPSPAEAVLEELVYNGDFRRGLDGWRTGNRAGFPPGADVEGSIHLIGGDRPAMDFSRYGSKGTHGETFAYQQLERDVSDFTSLTLTIRLKLVNQSLSGGGYVGSEYPLLVRVDYLTPGGPDFRVFGFYYQNNENKRTDNGILIPQDTWVDYVVPVNLISVRPQPRLLQSIEVQASGWDYESQVAAVSLQGE